MDTCARMTHGSQAQQTRVSPDGKAGMCETQQACMTHTWYNDGHPRRTACTHRARRRERARPSSERKEMQAAELGLKHSPLVLLCLRLLSHGTAEGLGAESGQGGPRLPAAWPAVGWRGSGPGSPALQRRSSPRNAALCNFPSDRRAFQGAEATTAGPLCLQGAQPVSEGARHLSPPRRHTHSSRSVTVRRGRGDSLTHTPALLLLPWRHTFLVKLPGRKARGLFSPPSPTHERAHCAHTPTALPQGPPCTVTELTAEL